MQITDKMVAAATQAIYRRHLKMGMLDPDEVRSASGRRWWMKEFEADARAALDAALQKEQLQKQSSQ